MAQVQGARAGERVEPGGPRRIFTPRVLEAALAVLVATVVGLGGFTSSTAELAKALLAISCTGLAVLLVIEAAARRRWTIR